MTIHSAKVDALFSDWHPHFTPRWLSERLARHLPRGFCGAVVDPACGAGNLLAAAAVRTRGSSRSAEDIEYVGVDVSARAVRACTRTLASLLPHKNFRVNQADFLGRKGSVAAKSPTAVVMNPPFRGYGELAATTRGRIARLLGMRGRFNLGYAFVYRAVAFYKPEMLVSLLPSNWVYSRRSPFRADLDALDGAWDWEDVGDRAFPGISAHLGILVWRPGQSRRAHRKPSKTQCLSTLVGTEVHQGVATGRDEVFIQIAKGCVPFGRRMIAVRGRDVGRGSDTTIWVPPRTGTDALAAKFAKHIGRGMLAELKGRTCVSRKGRYAFQYHDAMPAWFRGKPKLLVPEIATREVRVELDTYGTKLPLHSVIAIKVPSITAGRALKLYLLQPRRQRALLASAPRLSGGAVRIQVSALKELRVPRLLRSRTRR